MKKDIVWLKREIRKELESWQGVEGGIDEDGINEITLLINQLDEPEVKQLDKKIKELESYNDELIRDSNQLRNELDNQEVLSQEWIENHSASADTISYYSKDNVPVVTAFNLKGLLMPKQDKPVIPKFVADYIERWKPEGLTICEWFTFGNNEMDDDIEKWLYDNTVEENRKREYLLIDAIRNGYEVEKKKLYHVVNKENYFMLRKYDGLVDILHVSPSMSKDEYGKDTRFMLTEQEIKDYDERYIPFMVPVDEVNND